MNTMEGVEYGAELENLFPGCLPEPLSGEMAPSLDSNPLEDSSLNAILNNLQEGTLLSLLEDDNLFNDLKSYPLSPASGPIASQIEPNFSNDDFSLEDLLGDHQELVDFGYKKLGESLCLQNGARNSDANLEMNTDCTNNVQSTTFMCEQTQQALSPEHSVQHGTTHLQPVTTATNTGAASSISAVSEINHFWSPTPVSVRQATHAKLPLRKKPKAIARPPKEVVSESDSGSDTDVSSNVSNDSDAMECDEIPAKTAPQVTLKSPDAIVTDSREHLLRCVRHDHSYASLHVHPKEPTSAPPLEGQRSPQSVDGDSTCMEDGNSSDTGYETMSSSTCTSPGSNNSTRGRTHNPHPSPSPLTLPALPPLGSQVDPVALIDARIKHFMDSRQILLTEEEKATLKAEGLPIPTTLPLTKVEEKALKTVRRKIRNKMAAQESRRRKKEQLTVLEHRVRQFNSENLRLKRKVETLESENRSLLAQLKKLQAIVASSTSITNTSRTTQVGACLMVVVLCFAVFFGNWTPSRFWNTATSDYATATVRSRSLLSVEYSQNFQQTACDWFKHIFLPQLPPQLEYQLEEDDQTASAWTTLPSPWLGSNTLYASVTPLTLSSEDNSSAEERRVSARA